MHYQCNGMFLAYAELSFVLYVLINISVSFLEVVLGPKKVREVASEQRYLVNHPINRFLKNRFFCFSFKNIDFVLLIRSKLNSHLLDDSFTRVVRF